MNTSKIKRNITGGLLCFTLFFSGESIAQKSKTSSKSKTTTAAAPVTPSYPENSLHKLWLENAMWTRMYVVSTASDLQDKSSIMNRLRKNAEDIAKETKKVQPGVDEGRFKSLLDSNAIGVTGLIFSANLGQGTEAYTVKQGLMKQVDQMASFLNSSNPNAFPLAETKVLFQGYLNEIHNQVMARASKSWEADIGAFDRVNEHAVKIADGLIKGVPAMAAATPPPATTPAPAKKGK